MKAVKLKKRRSKGYWVILTVMSIGAVAMFFPTVWMLLCSFKIQRDF